MYEIIEAYREKFKSVDHLQEAMVIFGEDVHGVKVSFTPQGVSESHWADSGVSVSFRNHFESQSLPAGAESIHLDQEVCSNLFRQARRYLETDENDLIQPTITITSKKQDVYVYNSITGAIKSDCRYRTRVSIEILIDQYGQAFMGFAGAGLSLSFEDYMDKLNLRQVARTALKRARSCFGAQPIEREEVLPVILRAGYGAILVHEAVGHCLEADKPSPLHDHLGKRVASAELSIVQDPTCRLSWGNYNVDDEGFEAKKIELIKNGILVNHIHSLQTAKGRFERLGHSRRQGFRFPALPRMSTIILVPGHADEHEIIRDTSRGILVNYAMNGQVDFATGDFEFPVIDGCWIIDGRLSRSVSRLAIAGNCVQALENIDRIGSDFKAVSLICGKNSQDIEASMGQPTIRIDALRIVPREGCRPR